MIWDLMMTWTALLWGSDAGVRPVMLRRDRREGRKCLVGQVEKCFWKKV